MAKELARAGKSVLMLERGGLFLMDRGDFDQREDDMTARIDGGRGADNSDDNQLMLAYGHCVGGASVHYWADTWRTPKDRCDLWASKFGVEGHSYDELVPHFERIERDLNVHPAEDERLNRMNRLFESRRQEARLRGRARDASAQELRRLRLLHAGLRLRRQAVAAGHAHSAGAGGGRAHLRRLSRWTASSWKAAAPSGCAPASSIGAPTSRRGIGCACARGW